MTKKTLVPALWSFAALLFSTAEDEVTTCGFQA